MVFNSCKKCGKYFNKKENYNKHINKKNRVLKKNIDVENIKKILKKKNFVL